LHQFCEKPLHIIFKVVRPTRHKIGHIGDVPKLISWLGMEKLNLTQQKHTLPIIEEMYCNKIINTNKCSAVAEMGDHLVTTDMVRKGGATVAVSPVLGPHLTQCGLAEAYLRTKWHLDPSSPLATSYMGRKFGAVLLWGAGSPPNTMWPGSRPTSMISFILIHPTIWPQYITVSDRQDTQTDRGQWSDSIG